MILKFIEKTQLENNRSIYLVKGLRLEGKDQWAYMEMSKAQLESMNRDSKKKNLEMILSNYGTEIETGLGKKPNSQVRKRMKEEYGFRD